MKFIGRERELEQLNKIYHEPGFQMLVMYGRRRIGKTTLLNEFVKDKQSVFFMASRVPAAENLSDLSRTIAADSGLTNASLRFDTYGDAFHYLTERADDSGSHKLVIILDEFPYLMESMDGISSILQKTIDLEWQSRNIMLVLCGSSISMMEDEVLSEKSPLYGRRTAQMDVRPFDYLKSAGFTPGYSPEDLAVCYGITGGIPKYLSMINPEKSLDENIEELFFDDSGFFYEEPANLLQQEFRNVSSYNAVLQAVANGAVQVSEIAGKTHLDTSLVSQILQRLIRIRVIRRDEPVPPQSNKRYTQYVLNDGMFRFWYRYVASAVSAVERGLGADYYRHRVKSDLHDYMGLEFETMCREYVWNHARDFMPDLFLNKVGKWRGQDNIRRAPADIDVVGIDEKEKTAVIGECRFRTSGIGRSELALLRERGNLIRPYQVKQYLLFSLSGFHDDVDRGLPDTQYVTLSDMYR